MNIHRISGSIPELRRKILKTEFHDRDRICNDLIESSKTELDFELIKRIQEHESFYYSVVETLLEHHFNFLLTFSNEIFSKEESRVQNIREMISQFLIFRGLSDERIKNYPLSLQNLKKSFFLFYEKNDELRSCLLRNLDKLGICDERSKISFLLDAAEYEGIAKKIAYDFPSLGLMNLNFRQSLALKLAGKGVAAYSLSKNIKSLEIQNSSFLWKLALELVRYPWGIMGVCTYLENFGFTDPSDLLILADEILKHENKNGIASFAGKHKHFIRNPQLIPIYFEKILEHPHGLRAIVDRFYAFREYDFLDQSRLQKILLQCLDKDEDITLIVQADGYRAFCDSEFLKELVLKAVEKQNYAEYLPFHIQKFGFKDQELLFTIALEIAKYETGAAHLEEKFHRFVIDTKHKGACRLVEILRFNQLMQKRKMELIASFHKDWEDICGKSLVFISELEESLPESFSDELGILKLYFVVPAINRPDFRRFSKSWKTIFNHLRESEEDTKKIQNLKTIAKKYSSFFTSLDQLAKIGDPELQKKLAIWMYTSLSQLSRKVPKHYQVNVLQTKILQNLLNLRNHNFRYRIFDLFLSLVADQFNRKGCQLLLQSLDDPPHANLVNILLQVLKNKRMAINYSSFEMSLKKNRRKFLKDGEKLLMLLNALLQMNESDKLDFVLVDQLLSYFSQLKDKELCQELRSLNALFILDKVQDVSLNLENGGREQIFAHLKREFNELMPDFSFKDSQKFDHLFFGDRHPEALTVYLTGIQELPTDDRERMMDTIVTFLQELDQDQFCDNRYEKSAHLDQVFGLRVDLKEKWKQGHQCPLNDYLPDSVSKEILEKWILVNSDDPLDLFLAGTEAGGSCQRVDFGACLNKGLMGYVMDGKHRIIAIKNEFGSLVGRSILRLLLDEEKQKPVLFYERVYPHTFKPEYKEAMLEFAKRCARNLGLELTSKDSQSDKKYEGVLVSYGGRAPYEYCDASEGLKSERYSISDCYLLS